MIEVRFARLGVIHVDRKGQIVAPSVQVMMSHVGAH